MLDVRHLTYPGCVPILTDGVVTLRAHRPEDAQRIVEQSLDPAMVRFTTVPTSYGQAEAADFLHTIAAAWESTEAGANRYWALEVTSAAGVPRYAGTFDYRPGRGGMAEVGYGLHPDARGHGYATRALRLLVDHAFSTGLTWLHWRAVVGNWGSRRTAWACGFRIEATVRGVGDPSRDLVTDMWHASLRRDEPRHPTTPWYVPPVLDAGAVRLRPWRDDDVVPAHRDAESERYLGDIVPTASSLATWLLRSRGEMASGHEVSWCVADVHDDAVLGGIRVFALGSTRRPGGRLGYFLLPHGRGRGLLAPAIDAVLTHAFAPGEGLRDGGSGGLGLHRVAADADVRNLPSLTALRRAGFTPCGVKEREVRYADGVVADMLEVQALADDSTVAPAWRIPVQPTLSSGVVTLRPFEDDDLPILAEHLREPDSGPAAKPDATIDDAEAYLRRMRIQRVQGRALAYAVCAGGVPIGRIRAFNLDDGFYVDSAEIGYWIHAGARRNGRASIAVRLLVDHLLTPSQDGGGGLRRVVAMTAPENIPSQAVLVGAGFTRWSVEPDAVAKGSFGSIRSPFQPDDPSPERWHYHRVR